MKRTAATALFMTMLAFSIAQAAAFDSLPAGADDIYTEQASRLTVAGRSWEHDAAERVRTGIWQPDQVAAEAAQSCADAFGAPCDARDIDELAFLVLMDSAKSASEDLKSIVANVEAINSAKSRL